MRYLKLNDLTCSYSRQRSQIPTIELLYKPAPDPILSYRMSDHGVGLNNEISLSISQHPSLPTKRLRNL